MKVVVVFGLLWMSAIGCNRQNEMSKIQNSGSMQLTVSFRSSKNVVRFSANIKWDLSQKRLDLTLFRPDGKERAGFYFRQNEIVDVNFETRKTRIYKITQGTQLGISSFLSDASLLTARKMLWDPGVRRFPSLGKIVSQQKGSGTLTNTYLSTNGSEWIKVTITEDLNRNLPVSIIEKRSDSSGQMEWNYQIEQLTWINTSDFFSNEDETEAVRSLDNTYNNLSAVRALHELLIWN